MLSIRKCFGQSAGKNEHHGSDPDAPSGTGAHWIICDLQLRPGANEEQVEEAMRGHLPRKGELVGK